MKRINTPPRVKSICLAATRPESAPPLSPAQNNFRYSLFGAHKFLTVNNF